MRAPLDTNTLPSDLSARFAALRAPSTASPGANEGGPTSPARTSGGDFEHRLAALDAPLPSTPGRRVPVSVKTPDGHLGGQEAAQEDPVAAFLSSAASSSPSSFKPPSSAANRILLIPSPSALDTLSGVEIQFFRPSLGATLGDFDAGGEGLRGGSEEEELMRRMRGEVEVEERVRNREEEGVREWEKRLEGLKGVGPSSFSSSGRTGAGTAGGAAGLAPPPQLGELERALKKRERRTEKKGWRRGEKEEEQDSGEETESGTSSDEEAESAEDDSEDDEEDEREA